MNTKANGIPLQAIYPSTNKHAVKIENYPGSAFFRVSFAVGAIASGKTTLNSSTMSPRPSPFGFGSPRPGTLKRH